MTSVLWCMLIASLQKISPGNGEGKKNREVKCLRVWHSIMGWGGGVIDFCKPTVN